MALEKLSKNELMRYLERKYIFSGIVQGNLVNKLKNGSQDIESLENFNVLKSELEIHINRRDN